MRGLPVLPPCECLTPSPVALLALRATHGTLHGHGTLQVEHAVRLALREGQRRGLVSTADGRAALASSIFGTTVLRARLAYMLAVVPARYRRVGATSAEEARWLASAQLLTMFLLHEETPERCSRKALLATLPPASVGLPPACAAALEALEPSSVRWPASAVVGLAARHSLPCGLVRVWLRMLRSEAEVGELGVSLSRAAPVTLRANLAVGTRTALLASLRARGVACAAGGLTEWSIRLAGAGRPAWGGSVWSLPEWSAGSFEVQDEGSQCVVRACAAAHGERVLDMCAGNGGKALALAALVGADGAVCAHDVVPTRLAALRASARRAQVASRITTVLTDLGDQRRDGGELAVGAARGESCAPSGALEAVARAHGKRRGHDVVLLDVPCSSSGALRRQPSARWSGQYGGGTAAAARAALPTLQRQLLAQGAAFVRDGGRLVYATCALDARENQHVAEAFEADCAARLVLADASTSGTSSESNASSSSADADASGAHIELLPWPFEDSFPGRHDEPQRHFATIWPHRHGPELERPHAAHDTATSTSPDGFFIARWHVRHS